jgi:hypothetical protein
MLWIWLCDRFFWVASWLWHHPGKVVVTLWGFFFRVLTLVSVGYLVYDRIYEADATISASASDPKYPFTFPFTITNNSHVFAISRVEWACHALDVKWEVNNEMSNSMLVSGSRSVIPPGQVLNIDCEVVGPNSAGVRWSKDIKITSATIEIAVAYESDFFGVFSIRRQPRPTRFTWFSEASNPQWIKGEFAQ